MNFEEWFNKTFGESDYLIKGENRNGWNGCKQEILKILEFQDHFIGSGIKTCIKEIEKNI